jgi:hypothetical protein
MTNLNVIGLMGPIGCGKTTTAQILVRSYGYKRLRVADGIKRMLMALGLTEAQVDGDLKEVPCALLGGRTPRFAQQTLGTEWGRRLIDEDLWVRSLEYQCGLALADNKNVVIDDIRFPDEAAVVRRLGGSLYRVLRSAAEQPTNHVSEDAWREVPVDGVICNEFDMVGLQMQVRQIFDITLEDKSWNPINEQ